MEDRKDSGIPWIGEIPANWMCKKIKYATSALGSGTTPQSSIFEYYDGNIPWIQSGDLYGKSFINSTAVNVTDSAIHNISSLHVYEHDFIVLAMYGASVGNTAISKIDACSNQACCCIKPNKNNDIRFMYYYISICKDDFLRKAIGGGQPNISQEKIRNQYYLEPSLIEQNAISDLLDRKCGELDGIVADIQAEIESLKQYKQSVISAAVTKGLHHDVPMKDSGISWIGNVPEHWEVSKFKYWCNIKSNLVNPEKYLEYPQISPESIEKDSGKLLSHCTVEEAGVISGNHLFFENQVLYSKIRPNLNKVTIAPFKGLCSADMYPIEAPIPKFTLYMMLSKYFVEQVSVVIRDRVKMPKINQEELGNIRILLPSLEEQQEIADYLDAKCAEIDSLIATKEEQLQTLDSYKKSLIYEYVTGKKRVAAYREG